MTPALTRTPGFRRPMLVDRYRDKLRVRPSSVALKARDGLRHAPPRDEHVVLVDPDAQVAALELEQAQVDQEMRVVEEPPVQNRRVDLVVVRRDGSGRLVAVGLIWAADVDGDERWTTIGGSRLPDETIGHAVERCIAETLGPDAHAQLSLPPQLGMAGRSLSDRRQDAGRGTDRAEIEATYAVEVRGRLVPRGVARRFSWFLVTALPAREEIASGQRAVIADFLEAQGERGLAARLRQF